MPFLDCSIFNLKIKYANVERMFLRKLCQISMHKITPQQRIKMFLESKRILCGFCDIVEKSHFLFGINVKKLGSKRSGVQVVFSSKFVGLTFPLTIYKH